jgi:TRAP-type C4-dicarboxylate transport system substrate-binding protein
MVARTLTRVALATGIAIFALGCASGTKSGGTAAHQIRLVMQTPDTGEADSAYFIDQVQKLSGGQIQIVEGTSYSSADPNNEARLVRALRSGKVEMAYIPSRAWERASSVTAFRALQAPLLVTNYSLLLRITSGPIGSMMLASLGRIGLVGLGLVPNELRRPLGRKPLVSTADFRGARIRVVTSPTGVLALRSIGAVPLTNFTSSQLGPALQSGALDGAELSTVAMANNGYVTDAHYLTGNLELFAKTQTIAIRNSVFDRLSAADQRILRAAAVATVAHADPAKQERTEVVQLCRQGLRIVPATNATLASLQHEATTVYPALERDPVTRREMRAIERLEARLGAAPSTLAACPRARSRKGGSSATLAGTYVLTASQSEVSAAAGSHSAADNWGSFRLVLGDGRFRLSDQRPRGALVPGVNGHGAFNKGWTSGTYAIRGDQITFTSDDGAGDAPLATQGYPPVICSWSLYRGELIFRQLPPKAQAAATARGLDAGGPPALYVKPWQRRR